MNRKLSLDKFIAQLAKNRRKVGLSQYKLAYLCGVHQSTISRFETGHKNIRWATFVRIVRTVGFTLIVE